jgi:hypothetical protein
MTKGLYNTKIHVNARNKNKISRKREATKNLPLLK